MTLFDRADPDQPTFAAVLTKYFDGVSDPRTDALLSVSPIAPSDRPD
jgi:uncharacterized protein (DUF1810 family)